MFTFRVDTLVSDDAPGLLRFTWVVPAASREAARSLVRRKMRERGRVVRYILHIHKVKP